MATGIHPVGEQRTTQIHVLAERIFQRSDTGGIVLTHNHIYSVVIIFYNMVSELSRDVLGCLQSSLSRSMASCDRFTLADGGPDELACLKAFGEQVQTVCISPENFDGITPATTEDELDY